MTMTQAQAQAIHEARALSDQYHDGISCVCCCFDCNDLEFEFIIEEH
jgi:hypothetical protein